MSRKGFGYFMCLAYLSFLITCTGVGKIFLLQEFHPIKNQRSSFLLANFFNCHPFPMESKYKHADSPMFVNKSMLGTRYAHSPVTAKQTFHHVTHWHVTILGSQFFASNKIILSFFHQCVPLLVTGYTLIPQASTDLTLYIFLITKIY